MAAGWDASAESCPYECSKFTGSTQSAGVTPGSLLSIAQDSDEPFCRICHNPGGRRRDPLVRPCRCAGTLGDVHRTCLEKWLTLTRTKTCTICNYRFKTRTVMKQVVMWRWSPMSCPDVTLLTFVILSYITLLIQVIALCVLSVQLMYHRSYTLACGIAGLTIGIPWQITGCVGLTVDLYFSNYWTNWREQNKRVLVIFPAQLRMRDGPAVATV